MGVKKKQKSNPNKEFQRIESLPLRLTLLFLATIGDGVIYCSLKSFFYIRKGLHHLQRKSQQQLLAFRHFLGSFIIFTQQRLTLLRHISIQSWLFIRKALLKIRSKGKQTTSQQTQKIYHVLNRTRQFKFALPTPKLHLPRIHFSIPRPNQAFIGFVLGVTLTIMFVFVPYNLYLFVKFLPNPRLLAHRFIPVTTQIFDRNGVLLYEIHGDEDRKPVPLAEIPEYVKQATIAIEDKDFLKHQGISISGIIRAARETYLNNNTQGGSTITQQLIKNSLLTPAPTYERKIREVILAFWAEQIYTKDEILEMYLNQVPYGGTTWGIEAAAQRYFGKSIRDVNLSEAAFLAGLPAAPTLYSPYGTQPNMAKVRQHEVLRRMVQDGYITQDQANGAQNLALDIKPHIVDIKAPHFVMYVKNLLAQKYGPRAVDLGGLRVTTTLDIALQDKVQQTVTSNVLSLAKLKVSNGAAMVTNPRTGDILAMVGSKDYFDSENDGNVNVTLANRQPGSSIKPPTYAAALENGLTAMSFIDDSPISFPIPGQQAYTPVNYDGRFHGRVTMRMALANSYNIPAVKVLDRIGVKSLINMGRRMGITTWDDDSRFGLSLTLGGGEVKMIDMMTVYGVFANKGERVDLDPFLEISDYTGRVYYKRTAAKAKQVISSEVAFIISDILADNRARSQAFGPSSTLNIPGKTVSVKTGTTDQKRDNWTFGYTSDYVVGVWVGNNDNTIMDPQLTSGITGAAPIWNQVMTDLLKNKSADTLTPPANIVTLNCSGRNEYFIKGTEPRSGCPRFPMPSPSNQAYIRQG